MDAKPADFIEGCFYKKELNFYDDNAVVFETVKPRASKRAQLLLCALACSLHSAAGPRCRSPPFLKFGFSKFSEMEVTAMTVQKKYYIRIRKDLVEVTKEVYLEYYRLARRERAQKELEKKHGVFSYDALDAEGRSGSEMISDTVDIEELATAHILQERLHKALTRLPKAERKLLHAIYFDGLTERELQAKTGVPQTTISYQKRKALVHLKKILEN